MNMVKESFYEKKDGKYYVYVNGVRHQVSKETYEQHQEDDRQEKIHKMNQRDKEEREKNKQNGWFNESKTNKNMKKNVVKINENTLRQIVAESVRRVLKETELDYDIDNFSGRWNRGPRYNIYIGDTVMYRDIPEETVDRVWDEVRRKAEMWGEEPRCEEI